MNYARKILAGKKERERKKEKEKRERERENVETRKDARVES